MDDRRFQAYCTAMEGGGERQPRARIRHHLDYLFGGESFEGKRVLDVGGGDGALSFYAVFMGAAEVTCIEPEADGSTPGVLERFREIQSTLPDPSRVTLEATTFQDFDASGRRFELIFSKDTVNHLDESACADLHRRAAAAARYRSLFETLHGMAAPGARLILTDCSRHNLFARLGIRNPFYPSVEWHLHQPPRVWIELLSQAGFVEPTVSWKTFYRLGAPGRLLLGNRLAAYCLQSHFRLAMRAG